MGYKYGVRSSGMPKFSVSSPHRLAPLKAASMIFDNRPDLVDIRARHGGSNEICIVEMDKGMETTHRINLSELTDFMCALQERSRIPDGSLKSPIELKCDQVKNLLLKKNADYGNSALDPVRIFSKADSEEQIRVRIDDKLSRLAGAGEKSFTEDTVMDLVGYLILLMVKMEEGE